MFGYDMGAIAGALPQLTQQYGLSSHQQGWVVSILYCGGGLGALVGGSVCDQIGRLTTILATDVLFLAGAAWFIWVADSLTSLLIGRFLVGVAVALSGVADVAYLQEIAPQAWRGAIVSTNEACISLGFLFAYMAGYVYSDVESEDWRKIFGLAGIFALVQGVGMWSMPESPVWLAGKGRKEESDKAYQILQEGSTSRVGSSQEDDNEVTYFESIEGTADPRRPHTSIEMPSQGAGAYQLTPLRNRQDFRSIESLESTSGGGAEERATLRSPRISVIRKHIQRYRRQAWIALFMAITQQFCGQAIVLNYADAILGESSPEWSTLAMGSLKFLVTVVVISKIEAMGRKFMLLCGMGLIAFGLIALSLSIGWLVLPGVLAVVVGYSCSFGPLTWLLTAEIFPSEIRGRALGMSTIVTYLSAAGVTNTFLPTSDWLGGSSLIFGFYATITLMGMMFAHLAIPETGDRSLDQIEEALDEMFWWRDGKKLKDDNTLIELSGSQTSLLNLT